MPRASHRYSSRGKVVITRGIQALGHQAIMDVLAAVAAFSEFTPEDDQSPARGRRPGHWEADLMLFSRYGQSVLVAHERRSRLLRVSRQPSKAAAPVADSLRSMLAAFPEQQRRTITFDNGSELSEHHRLTTLLGMQTYFCDPHSPWQKGGIENAIGGLPQTRNQSRCCT